MLRLHINMCSFKPFNVCIISSGTLAFVVWYIGMPVRTELHTVQLLHV